MALFGEFHRKSFGASIRRGRPSDSRCRSSAGFGRAPQQRAWQPTRPPVRQPRSTTAACEADPLVLVIDESGSTRTSFRTASESGLTRMAGIQTAAEQYLQQLLKREPHVPVAVIGFSDAATLYHGLSPVGQAFDALVQAVKRLHPQNRTNLTAGLDAAIGQISRSTAHRGTIAVITDGAANVQTEQLPDLIALARSRRIRVYAIGVGNDGDGDFNRDMLFNMARSTGGWYYSAESFSQLCTVLMHLP